ncbi:hypothetical protein F511_35949 [Dorcoceras hygrometricum]|uniref:Uncharacterized protein n=1 Tax=Dorcoceras hygrometricum TaxID=472368 RepID=A0A2Z7BUJ7_9LAMI|nr:hypothetical protein F511_35949 [Dorcoceras hygrometricum]
MSTTTASSIRSVADAIDSTPESPEVRGPWLPDQAELGSKNVPWYEEKSSNLRSSDIPFIREKGGMSDKFEVVLPGPEERAHLPPRGFHSFYINQLDMGLWFPLPRFIAALCQQIKISPSQLAPNYYSFLLSLAVLLCYHDLPLGDHAFIKGNPSSHKGWMSRFFFVRRVGKKRNHWKCDMHWRDNVFTLSPRTPDLAPNLAPFLEAMHGKSYNAPDITKEDLLCFFKFSGKGVEFVGDLDERMGRAELLQAMQEAAHASGEVAPPKKVTKKRKAPSTAEKKARGEKRKNASASTSGAQKEEVSKKNQAPTPPTPTSEGTADVPPIRTTAEASSSGKGPERGHLFDPSKDSLVESPSAVAATRYICNMAPDRDLKVLREADNAEVIGHFSANISSAMDWGGEMVKRLTRAHQKATASRQRLDEVMGQHAEVLAWLEELEAHRAREEEEARIQREALEAELASEKEARAAEKAAREALEADLEEVKAQAVQEAEQLKSEAKEEFLKSPEFNVLLGQRAWGFFKNGFWGCLAQFRANGYPEEEHPASFLDVKQALAAVGDEEEAEAEEEEEE